jgi:hypothetical protein
MLGAPTRCCAVTPGTCYNPLGTMQDKANQDYDLQDPEVSADPSYGGPGPTAAGTPVVAPPLSLVLL